MQVCLARRSATKAPPPKRTTMSRYSSVTLKGKDKNQKTVKKLLVVNTRKQKLVTQNINIYEEVIKRVWGTITLKAQK